ncbi:hypothetical protein CEXT_2031 [Caerostris extrusa]|uniref:Uncharacterized protein n=1 Tax=Caerostris extrusa TaxID=172846 RepID=A0AAV4Q3M8_CAEEX|nr:hypothetical protein CEXT_2031 [Caerostris extrusa]
MNLFSTYSFRENQLVGNDSRDKVCREDQSDRITCRLTRCARIYLITITCFQTVHYYSSEGDDNAEKNRTRVLDFSDIPFRVGSP